MSEVKPISDAEIATLAGSYQRGATPYVSQRTFDSFVARLRAAEAERDKLLAERVWRPIETAPKDGSLVLVTGGWRGPLFVRWDQFTYGWILNYGIRPTEFDFLAEHFTHWMPLPAAPEPPA